MDTLTDLIDTLNRYDGEWAHEGGVLGAAQEWADAGFDADAADEWLASGVGTAKAARVLCDAGLRPGNVARLYTLSFQGEGHRGRSLGAWVDDGYLSVEDAVRIVRGG